MKFAMIALALMVSGLSQASTMKCYSLEEGFTPAVQVELSEVVGTVDVWGTSFELRSATVLLKDEAPETVHAFGPAELSSSISLSLNGVEVGTINSQANGVENRRSGTMTFKGVTTEIGCEVSL
jgi:hypothetical protein